MAASMRRRGTNAAVKSEMVAATMSIVAAIVFCGWPEDVLNGKRGGRRTIIQEIIMTIIIGSHVSVERAGDLCLVLLLKNLFIKILLLRNSHDNQCSWKNWR